MRCSVSRPKGSRWPEAAAVVAGRLTRLETAARNFSQTQPAPGRDPGQQRQPLHRRHQQPSHPHGYGRNREDCHGSRLGCMGGNGSGDYSGDNGPATAAGLNFPHAVAFDSAGNMYIPDTANNRVREVAAVGGAITASQHHHHICRKRDPVLWRRRRGGEPSGVVGALRVWPSMRPGTYISPTRRTTSSARSTRQPCSSPP